MRIKVQDAVADLVTDIQLQTVDKKQDANYFWFVQRDHGWEPTESPRRFLVGPSRAIGLLRSTTLDIDFDENDFLSLDQMTVLGSVKVDYKVKHPITAIPYNTALEERVKSEIQGALTEHVCVYPVDHLPQARSSIKKGVNAKLKEGIDRIGIELRIMVLDLRGKAVSQREQEVLKDISWEFQARRQREELALEIERIAQLGEVELALEMKALQAKHALLLQVPDGDPLTRILIFMEQNPNAGPAVAEVARTWASAATDRMRMDLLQAFIASKMGDRAHFGGHQPQLPPDSWSPPQLMTPRDPIERAIRERFSHAVVVSRPESGNKSLYVVTLDNLVIRFNVSTGKISQVLFGKGEADRTWRSVPRDGSPEQNAVSLVENISRSVQI